MGSKGGLRKRKAGRRGKGRRNGSREGRGQAEMSWDGPAAKEERWVGFLGTSSFELAYLPAGGGRGLRSAEEEANECVHLQGVPPGVVTGTVTRMGIGMKRKL